MNLIQPSQTKFTQAEAALTNLMQDYSTQVDTRKGSVIRELLIRPYAYIYAKIDEIISDWIRRTSVAYLSRSSQTSNSTADLVASNYFISRRQGGYATGVVTLKCSYSQIRVNSNTKFSVNSIMFSPDKTYIATAEPLPSTDAIGYVKMYYINNQYIANIPVRALQPGEIEIPAGVQVQISSYIAGTESAQLLSPITGGADTQTDASMMRRCKERCGAAIGTLQAIRTKMQDAPVNVLSCCALGSGQPGCFRSSYNDLAVPIGGAVDIYVKTQNQNQIRQVTVPATELNNKSLILSETLCPGACRVLSVRSVGVNRNLKYTVQYLSSDPSLSALGAKNTCKQKIKISFSSSLTDITDFRIALQCMPYVKQLQDFMEDTYGGYLGQDCLIKGAVPVTVKVACQLYSKKELTQVQLTDIKTFIAAKINEKQVGEQNLNMDQIAELVQDRYPDVKLRLPYTLSVSMPQTNGGVYNFSMTDGTASVLYKAGKYLWPSQAYFFSTTADFVDIQVIN